MSPDTNPTLIPSSDSSPFDSLTGGYKTYITAGLGILFNFLQAFGLFTFSDNQTMAINGIVVMAVAIFLRLGVHKAQLSAVKAAQSAHSAQVSSDYSAVTAIKTLEKIPTPAKVATIDRDSFTKP